eukprot:6088-Heterococcus_DN1.PRE.2
MVVQVCGTKFGSAAAVLELLQRLVGISRGAMAIEHLPDPELGVLNMHLVYPIMPGIGKQQTAQVAYNTAKSCSTRCSIGSTS